MPVRQEISLIGFAVLAALLAGGYRAKRRVITPALNGVGATALRGQCEDVAQVVFSPDGKRILASNTDKAARLWPTDYHDTIRALCAELTRDLTHASTANMVLPARVPRAWQ
jgi:WD40 repeat protein